MDSICYQHKFGLLFPLSDHFKTKYIMRLHERGDSREINTNIPILLWTQNITRERRFRGKQVLRGGNNMKGLLGTIIIITNIYYILRACQEVLQVPYR